MVHVYYHIYAIDGVESIIDEQLNLIKKYFDFPYILNVGISIANENKSINHILDKFDKIRDVRFNGDEWITLELIEMDKHKFGNSDYILYLHTKGVSKIKNENYNNIVSWRQMMNYFNIERVKNVFKLFEKTNYNTYGALLGMAGNCKLYSGNFWWMTSNYAKTIDVADIGITRFKTRFDAELNYVQNGIDWKPYSEYNRENENHYGINFKREEYIK